MKLKIIKHRYPYLFIEHVLSCIQKHHGGFYYSKREMMETISVNFCYLIQYDYQIKTSRTKDLHEYNKIK